MLVAVHVAAQITCKGHGVSQSCDGHGRICGDASAAGGQVGRFHLFIDADVPVDREDQIVAGDAQTEHIDLQIGRIRIAAHSSNQIGFDHALPPHWSRTVTRQ